MKSETIGELAAALSLAQGEMKGAIKDTDNPFFNRKYADLGAVWDACRDPLAKNKLAVVQTMRLSENGSVIVETTLMHASGQWISGEIAMNPVREKKGEGFVEAHDPQAIGSAISYARRYGLAAMVGVYQEDDDGNKATKPAQAPRQASVPNGTEQPSTTTTRKPADSEKVISDAQCKRFHAIGAGAGWKSDDLKVALKHTFGLDSSKDIPWSRYDAACEMAKNGPKAISTYTSPAAAKDLTAYRHAIMEMVIEAVGGDMLEVEPFLKKLTGAPTVDDLDEAQCQKAIHDLKAKVGG